MRGLERFARIVVPHQSLDDDIDYHEWITMGDKVKLDSRLRCNPRMYHAQGQRWVCNNPACDGLAYVLSDQLGQAAIWQAECQP